MRNVLGFAALFLGVAGFAFAVPGVPEIDPSSGTAAIALLSGGLLILRSRRKK